MSNVVTDISPATVNTAEPNVNKSVSPAPPIVPPDLITRSSLTVRSPAELSVKASFVEATPIVPPSLIIISSATVSRPAELNDIFSEAASLAPVLNESLVALLSAAKSPSDTAAIPAATKIASVPVPSSGA